MAMAASLLLSRKASESQADIGGSGFPKIGADGTVTLTLGSRDFYWLRLETEEDNDG